MIERKYPRQAWVLLPSFKPKEVTVVKAYGSYSSSGQEWDIVESGKSYHISSLFDTKELALADGRLKIDAMKADIEKRQATMDKRIAALDAAEAK